MMNYKTQIRQALARGYCTPENEHKELDAVLIEAMTIEVLKSVGFIPVDGGVEYAVQPVVMPGRVSDAGTGWRRAEDGLPEKEEKYLVRWLDVKSNHSWDEISKFYIEKQNGVCISIDGHWSSFWENEYKKVTWWTSYDAPPEE